MCGLRCLFGSVDILVGRHTRDLGGCGFESHLCIVEFGPGQASADTHLLLTPKSIIWYWPDGGDAVRPGRSGAELSMRYKLLWYIHLHGLKVYAREISTLHMLI